MEHEDPEPGAFWSLTNGFLKKNHGTFCTGHVRPPSDSKMSTPQTPGSVWRLVVCPPPLRVIGDELVGHQSSCSNMAWVSIPLATALSGSLAWRISLTSMGNFFFLRSNSWRNRSRKLPALLVPPETTRGMAC